MRSYSVSDIRKWKFNNQTLPVEWTKHLGTLPERFSMYVDGDPGNGKTEYVLQAAKMLAMHMGKVRLNNVEQGKHEQIQQSVERNRFNEIAAGKFQYDSILDYDRYKAKIKRPNSGKIQIIDSISYWPLSEKQIQELLESFRYKSFIFVAYRAHAAKNRPIAHLCDIKVQVDKFKATSVSRFGGNEPFVIWDKKVKPSQLQLV